MIFVRKGKFLLEFEVLMFEVLKAQRELHGGIMSLGKTV